MENFENKESIESKNKNTFCLAIKKTKKNPPNDNTSANTILRNNLDLGEPKLTIRLPKINDVGGTGTNHGSYNGNGARPNGTFLPMPTRKH